MRISDWSSDVCSSDLVALGIDARAAGKRADGRQRAAEVAAMPEVLAERDGLPDELHQRGALRLHGTPGGPAGRPLVGVAMAARQPRAEEGRPGHLGLRGGQKRKRAPAPRPPRPARYRPEKAPGRK